MENNEEANEENENIEKDNVKNYILPIDNEIKKDQFSEYVENVYHLYHFIDSISALTYESIICQKIIDYKKKNNFEDVDIWENKKSLIDFKLNNKQDMINVGHISLKDYYNGILKELKVEEKHLNKLKSDENVKNYEKFALQARINKRIEIIKDELKQIKNLIKNEEENENKKIKNKTLILNLIDNRLEEYKNALIYFNKNNLTERQKICYKDALKIQEIKKNIEKDDFSNVNEIPKQIMPEYIYGYSNKEREEKFKEIFKYLILKKNDENKKLINFSTSIKKLEKDKLKKIESQIIKDIESMKNIIKSYDELI